MEKRMFEKPKSKKLPQYDDEESAVEVHRKKREAKYGSGDDSETNSYNSYSSEGNSNHSATNTAFFEERETKNPRKLFQGTSSRDQPGPSGSSAMKSEEKRRMTGNISGKKVKRLVDHVSGDDSVFEENNDMLRKTRRDLRPATSPDDKEDDQNDETHSSDSESLAPEGSKTTSALLLAEESSQLLFGHGIQEGNLWNVLVYGEPVQRTEEQKIQYEKLIYWPSEDSVNLNEKLPRSTKPRYPEDEGLFIGKPLSIAPRNKKLLERRLIKERAFQWFGLDGELIAFPNPYRPEPIQLFRDDIGETDFNKSIVFVPAKLDPYQEFQLDPKTNYEIVLDIGSLNFTHHYLFSKEHVLAARLELAMQKYLRIHEMKSSERAENKLKALREVIVHTKAAVEYAQDRQRSEAGKKHSEDVDQLKDRITRYRSEMSRVRLTRDQSLWDERAALVAVVDVWKQLKTLRQNQGFINTLLKLNIMTVNEDHSAERAIWEADIEQEMRDLQEEYHEEFEYNMACYRAQMKEWLELRRLAKAKSKSKSADETVNDDDAGKKRKSKKAKSIDTELVQGDDSNSESTSSDMSLSKKPVPPQVSFDAEETKKAIEKRFRDVKRLPGEPKVILELTRSSSITSKAQLPPEAAKEEQRRKTTNKTKMELRIRFNRKEVYRSKLRDLNADFTVFFGLTIPIVVNEWPETLTLEIVDNGLLTKKLIYEIDVPLPNSKTSIDRSHMQKMEFSLEEVVKTGTAGVGSGVDFEIFGNDKETEFTSGYVTVRLGWSTDTDGNILCPKGFERIYDREDINKDSLKHTPKHELRSASVIQKWTQSAQVDPNDPQNARWLHLAKNMKRSYDSKKSTKRHSVDDDSGDFGGDRSEDFELDHLMGEFEFCTMESIENSLRYRLLQLRDDEVPEFKGIKMVAPYEKDIPLEAFDAYERRLKEDNRKRLGESSLVKGGRKRLIDDDSIYEANRLEKIREMRVSVLQRFENSLKHITFEDIVVEEQMPDIGTLGLNLMTLFQPRRPLRPTRKERKRVQGSSLVDTKISLIVNIVRAFNLPIRRDTDVGLLTTESVTGIPLMSKRSDRNGSANNYSTVKPFVEIWFQRNVCRTTTALGSNPTWNQELQLGLAVPNDDYSPGNLSRMDDYVYLLVYDEVAVNLLEDDRRKETDIHQRLEKRWLGSITIPFSTLFANGRIEGTFKINSPPILLGYEAQRMASHFGTSTYGRSVANTNILSRQSQNSFPFNNQKNAFITLFITLQPAVNPPNMFKEESATGETPDMMAHVRVWKNSFQRKFPDRFVKPFVMTPDGDTVLCTRFLRSLEPPPSLLVSDQELIKTMEDLAHYVSLFPSVRDSTLGITDYGLWFTSDVFVMTPGGGIEDHAVLLACFFMHLKISCWIIQGNAIPDGPTTYVATSFVGLSEDDSIVGKNLKNAVLIWNPCNGEYYNANDNFCPLQKVWAALSKSNMWVNFNEGERPHQLDWNIEKSKHWLPLFPKAVAESKVPSLQPGTIKFKTPDKIQANSLAQRIERHLKEAFMKWRKTSKTNWNRYCSATLRRLLPKLEETKSARQQNESGNVESTLTIQSSSPTSMGDEHLMELREVMTSYQITGFPLQQAYVNMESITESVYATGVHTIDTPDVEFAVAAYAQAYPASVYSVWIYVAALHRRK